jgi:MutS domain V
MTNAKTFYEKNVQQFKSELAVIDKKIKQFSNLRLFIFLAGVIAAALIWRSHQYVVLTIELLISTVLFVATVLFHSDLYKKRFVIEKKLLINKKGLSRINGDWGDFEDTGDQFIDHAHPYTYDLDIFGKHSLYQWICTAHTYSGRNALADALSSQQKERLPILAKQDAVKELAALPDWRQQFELYGMLSETGDDPSRFLEWAENKKKTFNNPVVSLLLRILPYISLCIGLYGFLFHDTLIFFAVVYGLQLALFGVVLHSRTAPVIEKYEKNGKLLFAFSQLINTIEKQQFTSSYNIQLRNRLITGNHKSASSILASLSKILTATEIRSSPMVHAIANAVWLWDVQCVIKADTLKIVYGSDFRMWITAIGQFEVVASLAISGFENPQWIYPEISDSALKINAEKIGHPLINAVTRIVNNITIDNAGVVAVITGSNMSGKSTFLRTLAINTVLAYAGAPVCAVAFVLPLVNIYSSMRISDDLSSHVSTFYAELVRIRMVVEAVKRGEKVLFLLDELFRGTNSQDRHDGAVAVLKTLSNSNTIGIVSTHDLELCNLAEISPDRYVNFHFEEFYRNDTIEFDYTLKMGRSTTKNALFLIRMIGIEI